MTRSTEGLHAQACAIADRCEGTERLEWLAIAALADVDLAYLIAAGVYDRGCSAEQMLGLLSLREELAARKSERAPKRVRGPGAKTLELRGHVVAELADFDGSMSTRQVFYRLVSRGALKNTALAYEGVSRLLVQMRRDGTIPYGRIVDRTRRVHKRSGWAGLHDAMEALASQYRRDPWDEQPVHVHIACEKQALEGVFADVVDDYGAPLYVLRGFTSEAFVYEWASEVQRLVDEEDRSVVVAYFGDHDPSGLAIERDCRDRLIRHLSDATRSRFEWHRSGLLFDDLDGCDLVNVPVKHGDSRARAYLAEYGDRAAELDALPPAVLRDRVLGAIRAVVDDGAWDRVRCVEAAQRESLGLITANIDAALAAARSAA